MSRVHDSLKRVEQQRSSHKGVRGNVLDTGAPSVMGVSEPIAMPIVDISESQDASNADVLLERCPPRAWAPEPKAMLFFNAKEQAPGTEEFRALRAKLYHLREQISLKKVLVTSSLPREGRSFVAANLAHIMSRQQGCRTLLLDADLRSPSLHSVLGAPATPGLSEYLLGEAGEFEIIQRGLLENLFYVASGRPISGQSEIVSNGRLKLLFDRIGMLFDWIIVDSPATMLVSDSGVIANSCDGVLMVVRSHATAFDVVRKAREKFRPEHVLGVVLNGIPSEPNHESPYDPDDMTSFKPHGKWRWGRRHFSKNGGTEPPYSG